MSCASLKRMPHNAGRKPLSKLHRLNGVYSMQSINNNDFESALSFEGYYIYGKRPKPGDHIVLKAISNRKIIASTYAGDSLIGTRTLRGRIQNNCFHYKQSSFRSWVILSSFRRRQGRLSILPGERLLVQERYTAVAFLLIIPFTGSDRARDSLVFERMIQD